MYAVLKELLDAHGSNISPEAVIERIKNNPHYDKDVFSSKQISENVIKLSSRASNQKQFIRKYEEMKARNIESLGSIVSMLYMVLYEDIKAKSPKPKIAAKPVFNEGKVVLSNDDLPEVIHKIRKAAGDGKRANKKYLDDKLLNHGDNQNELSFPPWLSERSNLSADFPNEKFPITSSIGAIPKISQESILIEDLLYSLEGIPGKYIVPLPIKDPFGPRNFDISSEVDEALRNIIQQLLPLASHYSIIVRFIESTRFWSGKVLHALVNAMEALLKDYYILIAQLETEHMAGTLNLQKLWYFVRPIMNTMEILATISANIKKNDCKSGSVLSLLHEQTNALLGNTKAQEICLFLTQSACKPYMQMLQQWIYNGAIDDPFQEFLVEDMEIIKKEELLLDYSADYWEKRYMIQRDRIPKFLERYADIILRTGKYLNVISQCGKSICMTDAEDIKYALREQHYLTAIQKAYSFASKSLLELLMKEYDLMGRLKSVKHYFLMDQGDFIVQFMDASEQELSKNIDDIIPTRLESLLGLCLKLSAACHDQYNEDMRTELLSYDLKYQMMKINVRSQDNKEYQHHDSSLPLTGWDSFTFGIDVKWPVSLILNRKAIAMYQMIFRHLFYCKHVERMLCKVWLCNKVAKRFSEARQYSAAFALRQRMLSCLQNLQYYMCIEVVEPNWCAFIENLNKVTNIDEVLARHSDFLEVCLEDCMLTNMELLTTVMKLCHVCVQFCQFFQSQGVMGNSDVISKIVPPGDSFEQSITRFDLCFTAALLSLLNIINDMAKDNNTKKLVDVMYRLNFNTFYSEQLDRWVLDNSMNESQEQANAEN